MAQEQKKSHIPQIGEAVFCIAYLAFDLVAAIILFVNAKGSQVLYLFSVLTLSSAEAMRFILFHGSQRHFAAVRPRSNGGPVSD